MQCLTQILDWWYLEISPSKKGYLPTQMSGHRAGGDDPGLSHLVACGVGREWGALSLGGGGGGTYPSFGYPLQNRPQRLLLSMWSNKQKRRAYSVGAVVLILAYLVQGKL